jgi:hypothetical protein
MFAVDNILYALGCGNAFMSFRASYSTLAQKPIFSRDFMGSFGDRSCFRKTMI